MNHSPTIVAAAKAPTSDANVNASPRLPELLAPAGDWDCAKAAVENGADAIYFGLDRFNARMRARNFTEADLPRLMQFLHRRGVRGYVTFNTLVFTAELEEAEQFLRSLIAAGVDAAIVQDVGICRLIRRLSPDFPIHASTQMTITSAAGIEFARELGCHLVVLARECSLKEIGAIQRQQAGAEGGRGVPTANGYATCDAALEGASIADGPSALLSTAPSSPVAMPLEVFVHGALCVAYSGQCLTSESLGGRSANRGECAQACRLPYELVSDGQTVPLGERRYLLSPQDLASVELLPALARLGVASLKIEGRLKSPEYVASITRIYREALDKIAAQDAESLTPDAGCQMPDAGCEAPDAGRRPAAIRHANPESEIRDPGSGITPASTDSRAATQYEMEMAFSRGLHTGWFEGVNNQRLVHARFPKKRGVYLGEVLRVSGDRVHVRLAGPLKPGDGVVFDAGQPDQQEEGGRVYEIRSPKSEIRNGLTEIREPKAEVRHPPSAIRHPPSACSPLSSPEVVLAFGRGDIDFRRIRPGDKLWKTSDPELERRLRRSYAGETIHRRRPLQVEVHGAVGEPLTLLARDESGHLAQSTSSQPLAAATTQPLTTDRLREQLGRLGGTPFTLDRLDNRLEGGTMLPLSELNRLRREAVAELERQRLQPDRWTMNAAGVRATAIETPLAEANAKPPSNSADLIVLVRRLDQLEAALAAGVQTIYCELEDPKRYRDAVRCVRESPAKPGSGLPGRAGLQGNSASDSPSLYVAPPRITKPGEDWILRQVRSCEADGYLVRNPDHLRWFAGCRCVGDYSLNVANPLSAEYFLTRFGLERVTASYDLNGAQLEALLLRAAPPAWFEITIHQHMPMFHMEHCVFCAFLSDGTDFTNCGRPCDRHAVQLRDRVGALHPVKADAGCRNTVFNALAQTGAEYAARFLALGARHFRLEFLDESPEIVTRTIGMYRGLLQGDLDGAQLWRELKLRHQLGVTRGSLDRGERPVTVL